jgi:hypothetical protein
MAKHDARGDREQSSAGHDEARAGASSEPHVTGDELARIVGITQETLVRLVHIGVIEPVMPAASAPVAASEFPAASALRLRRMLRLHDDLDLDLVGAAIIVDLLERLALLERDLARLGGAANADRRR